VQGHYDFSVECWVGFLLNILTRYVGVVAGGSPEWQHCM
jgi:hypothetical protein